MRGILYGVGVGPGDPELMTFKAARRIRESDVIAVPGKEPRSAAAYKIAVESVPEIADKELIPVCMPMTEDLSTIDTEHRRAAEMLKPHLDAGRDVAYITLGDPAVYSTFSYIQRLLEADGYAVQMISGVPSFCAAAARLGVSLVEWDEPLHVLPVAHRLQAELDQPGTYVLMKTGKWMTLVKEKLLKTGRDVSMVENCGMDGERVYRSVEEVPEDAGYFSLIIAKEAMRK